MLHRTLTGLNTAWNLICDTVFPPSCVYCKSETSPFCENCRLETPQLGGRGCTFCAADSFGSICHSCTKRPPNFEQIVAPFRMEDPVKTAIHAFKYGDVRFLSGSLAEPLSNKLKQVDPQPDLLTAIPLHRSRMRHRGYNQSELLAKKVSKNSGIPYVELLKRLRHTTPQVELNAKERRQSVKDIFEYRAQKHIPTLKGLSVAIVDDVATTASTLDEAAKALKQMDATRVIGVVLARETSSN